MIGHMVPPFRVVVNAIYSSKIYWYLPQIVQWTNLDWSMRQKIPQFGDRANSQSKFVLSQIVTIFLATSGKEATDASLRPNFFEVILL